MIVGDDAAGGLAGDDRDAGPLDEGAQLLVGAAHHTPLPTTSAGRAAPCQQADRPGDELGRGAAPAALRVEAGGELDVGVVELGVDEVDRDLEVHRARPARPRLAERQVDVLGDPVEVMHAPRPLGHLAGHLELVERLDLAGVLTARRGGAGDAHHRRAVGPGVGETGQRVGDPGARR